MSESERMLFAKISKVIGYDLRNYYAKNGITTGSDWEMTNPKKMEYINLAQFLADKYELKFYVADNNMGCLGCNGECCGTDVLHDYRIWGNNTRSRQFPDKSKYSEELGKCKVNFVRSQTNANKTMNEVSQRYNEKQKYALKTLV
jgi:hypothetical protein